MRSDISKGGLAPMEVALNGGHVRRLGIFYPAVHDLRTRPGCLR